MFKLQPEMEVTEEEIESIKEEPLYLIIDGYDFSFNFKYKFYCAFYKKLDMRKIDLLINIRALAESVQAIYLKKEIERQKNIEK